MRVGRRRVAVVATVLVALAAGTGVARAYYAPGAQDLGSPEGYFSFCARSSARHRRHHGRQPTAPPAATTGIDNYVYDQPGPLVGEDLAGTETFVLSKSGIESNGVVRRVVTTQRIEYAEAARTTPVQIRCKMRTHESLIRPETEKQRFDNGTPSTVPWGFGPQAATGTPKICRVVQDELVAAVWNSLTPASRRRRRTSTAPRASCSGRSRSRRPGRSGPSARRSSPRPRGRSPIADRSLDAPVGTINPIGDRDPRAPTTAPSSRPSTSAASSSADRWSDVRRRLLGAAAVAAGAVLAGLLSAPGASALGTPVSGSFLCESSSSSLGGTVVGEPADAATRRSPCPPAPRTSQHP